RCGSRAEHVHTAQPKLCHQCATLNPRWSQFDVRRAVRTIAFHPPLRGRQWEGGSPPTLKGASGCCGGEVGGGPVPRKRGGDGGVAPCVRAPLARICGTVPLICDRRCRVSKTDSRSQFAGAARSCPAVAAGVSPVLIRCRRFRLLIASPSSAP